MFHANLLYYINILLCSENVSLFIFTVQIKVIMSREFDKI